MLMTSKPIHFFIGLLWAVWSGSSVALNAVDEYLDISARYSHGDFDTSLNSRLYQLQFSYGKFFHGFDASVSSSLLMLSDELGEDTGLGDLYLHAGKVLGDRRNTNHELYGSIELKLPAADEATALGTGEADLGLFLNYTRRIRTNSLMVMAGYMINGDSPDTRYHDIFSYGMGASGSFERWYPYVRIEGQQQRLDSGSNPLSLNTGLFYSLAATRFIKLDTAWGLNDASADMGITLGYVLWF